MNDFGRKLGRRNSESAELRSETEDTRLTRTADNKSNPVTLLAIESAGAPEAERIGRESEQQRRAQEMLQLQKEIDEEEKKLE